MGYILLTLIGFICGGVCLFFLLENQRKVVEAQRRQQENQIDWLQRAGAEAMEKRATLEQDAANLRVAQAELDARKIPLAQLEAENAMLKRDLRNIDASLRKLQLDRDQQRTNQESLDARCEGLGQRYLDDNVKWLSTRLRPDNFADIKRRLLDVVSRCRDIGLQISKEQESRLVGDLKRDFEQTVRAALEREEQARIREKIREEQKREREIERELKQVEREREAIRVALEQALASTKDQHTAEIEQLRSRLAEAESRTQRAVSQAELTKSGHVYVISNVGSFGENVFKIGMTRRLEPLDRVKELGDASVPFPFDIHMMISSEDAPALENALHRKFHTLRVNKTNPKKEFFRVDIAQIVEVVRAEHGEVDYLADAEALQYRQSLEMTDEDEEFIETVYDRLADDGESDDEEE